MARRWRRSFLRMLRKHGGSSHKVFSMLLQDLLKKHKHPGDQDDESEDLSFS